MRQFAAVLASVALAACGTLPPRGGGYYLDDGPDAAVAVDIAKISDAVPRNEPHNERNNRPYSVFGVSYRPLKTARGYRERGVASWYGKKFHGQRTANGETYDMYAMSAAHKTLPLPSYLRVRNLQNGRAVIVRVNDRGPFLHDRVIDLSYAAAYKLGIVGTGTGLVEVETVEPGEIAPVTATTQPATPPPRHPGLEIIPTAAADGRPPPPKLYLQIGAFTRSENAESLRARLAQTVSQPVLVQPPAIENKAAPETAAGAPVPHPLEPAARHPLPKTLRHENRAPPPEPAPTPLYRVRIGPLANVEEGDRLGEQLRALGHSSTRIVVE